MGVSCKPSSATKMSSLLGVLADDAPFKAGGLIKPRHRRRREQWDGGHRVLGGLYDCEIMLDTWDDGFGGGEPGRDRGEGFDKRNDEGRRFNVDNAHRRRRGVDSVHHLTARRSLV